MRIDRLFLCLYLFFFLACAGNRKEEEMQKILNMSFTYHLRQGNAKADSAKYEKAIEHYKKAIDLIFYEPVVHNNLGVTYFRIGKLDSSIAAYQQALSLRPGYVQAYLNLANAYLEKKENNLALLAVQKSLEYAPGNAAAHGLLATVYEKMNKTNNAIAAYKQAIQIDSTVARYYINLGVLYYRKGMIYEAMSLYEQATKIDSANEIIFFNWGNSLARLCELEEAVDKYSKALDISPEFSNAYNNRGLCLLSLKRYAPAIENFYRALEFDSTQAPVYFNLAIVHERTENFAKALELINQAIELDSSYSVFYLQKGNIFEQLRDHRNAFVAYKKAIQLSPEFPFIYNNLGNLYFRENDVEQASKAYEKALDLYPQFIEERYFLANQNIEKGISDLLGACDQEQQFLINYAKIYTNLGTTYLEMNQPEKAKSAFEMAIKSDPMLLDAYEQLAWIYQNEQEQDRARRFLARARYILARRSMQVDSLQVAEKFLNEGLYFNAKMPEIHASLAYIAFLRKNPGKAERFFKQAMAIDAGDPQSLSLYGRYLKNSGQLNKAIDIFHQLLNIDNQSLTARENLIEAYRQTGEDDKADHVMAEHHYIRGQKKETIGLWDQALSAYENASELDADNSDYLAARGLIHLKKHHNETATELFMQALAINPDNAKSLYGLGVLAGEDQDHEKAIQYLSRALVNKTDYAEAHYAKSINHYFLQQYDKAWTSLQLAIEFGYRGGDEYLNILKSKNE